ncbi:hypothetical protein KAU45_04570 [bacterium]|nr:hypothetical protein [bacterium]
MRVYIIGSGTSIDTGIPTSTQLFDKALELLVKTDFSSADEQMMLDRFKKLYNNYVIDFFRKKPLLGSRGWLSRYKDIFDYMLVEDYSDYIDFTDKVKIKSNIYPEDLIERLITISQHHRPDRGADEDNLIESILSLYFQTIFFYEREYIINQKHKCAYDRIAKEINHEKDFIITFNYDTILERKLKELVKFEDSNYYMTEAPQPNRQYYYKPHKSINWFQCDECGNLFIDWEYRQLPGNRVFTSGFQILETPCCGHDTANPVLVMPSSHKHDDEIWRYGWKIDDNEMQQIEECLNHADEVIISGYSLPQQDTYFNDVLFNSLGSRRGCGKKVNILIVSSNIKEAFRVGKKLLYLLCAKRSENGFDNRTPLWSIYLSENNYSNSDDPREHCKPIEAYLNRE